jgi:hypothetical protein
VADWSYFYPKVLPHVIGAPLPLVDLELRTAARTFFDRTRAWRDWSAPITTVDGVRQYPIGNAADTEVVRLERATKDANPLPVDGWMSLYKDPALHANTGDGLSSKTRQTVILGTDTPGGAVLQLLCSLRPSDTAQGLPDHLAAQYDQAIADGALAALRDLDGQTWSNPQAASQRRARFEAAIEAASARVFSSHTNTMPRARLRLC